MVGTVVEMSSSCFGPCLYFMFMISFRIGLVSRLVQLESWIRGQVEGHIRVQLICEVRFMTGVVANVLDQFGAS